MSPRRGFLALVGGAFVTGRIGQTRAATPTLLLPPNLVAEAPLDASLAGRSTIAQAVQAVVAGLPDELLLDWLEGGLRMVKGCKPGGNIHRAYVLDMAEAGRVPKPAERWIGPGGRTPHEQAYLLQTLDEMQASVKREAARSNSLPIRQNGGRKV